MVNYMFVKTPKLCQDTKTIPHDVAVAGCLYRDMDGVYAYKWLIYNKFPPPSKYMIEVSS
jgi:hypothetical protein